MAIDNTYPELAPPTVNDFDEICAYLVILGESEYALRRHFDSKRSMFVKSEQIFEDEVLGYPTTISITGLFRATSHMRSMVIRYREHPHHPVTYNSAILHNYVMRVIGGTLVEARHDMFASPDRIQPAPKEFVLPHERVISEEGADIIKANTGRKLDLAVGDVSILAERILTLCGDGTE